MTRRRRGHDVLRDAHPSRIWMPDVPGHRQKSVDMRNLEARMRLLLSGKMREGVVGDDEFERLQKLIDQMVGEGEVEAEGGEPGGERRG